MANITSRSLLRELLIQIEIQDTLPIPLPALASKMEAKTMLNSNAGDDEIHACLKKLYDKLAGQGTGRWYHAYPDELKKLLERTNQYLITSTTS